MPTNLDPAAAGSADTIADHIDHLFRAMIRTPDTLATQGCFRYSTGEPHPFGNLAVFARSATPGEIVRDLGPFAAAPFPTAAMLLTDATPDQQAAITGLGYFKAESMPLMSVVPGALTPTTLPEGYGFREIDPASDMPAWSEAFAVGYGIPRPVADLFADVSRFPPGTIRYYSVEHGGKMVATSILYLHDGLAGIYGVSTVPEHRQRGLGAHATAEPLRQAWSMGYSTGLLQASEMGAPVYKRLGFSTHGHLPLFVRVPA